MLPWRSWYNLTTSNIISNQVYKIHYHECWGYFRVWFSSETLPSTAICGRETSRVKKCAWSQWAAAAVQVQNFRSVFFSQNKRKRDKKRQNPIPHNIGKSDYPNRQKKQLHPIMEGSLSSPSCFPADPPGIVQWAYKFEYVDGAWFFSKQWTIKSSYIH